MSNYGRGSKVRVQTCKGEWTHRKGETATVQEVKIVEGKSWVFLKTDEGLCNYWCWEEDVLNLYTTDSNFGARDKVFPSAFS